MTAPSLSSPDKVNIDEAKAGLARGFVTTRNLADGYLTERTYGRRTFGRMDISPNGQLAEGYLPQNVVSARNRTVNFQQSGFTWSLPSKLLDWVTAIRSSNTLNQPRPNETNVVSYLPRH